MQAVEFKTQPQNGMIKLPSQFQQWDKPMRVILLVEEIDSAIQIPKEPTGLSLKQSQTANDAKTFDEPEELGKLANLKERSYIVGDPEDIVHIDWFNEWNPQCI
ncbi:MAG: hypothetical protein ABFS56_06740 [Pseudomonadota bacterium]